MTEDTLVLIYGMACPLKCDFCCHPVEEYGPVKMAKEEALGYIEQAAKIESFGLVVFTGGDPFVYYKELLQILEQMPQDRFRVRIVTAAFWAKSYEKARKLLEPLRARGLSELSLSTDPSHQLFTPREYVENAARAAVDIGLETEVAAVFWNPDLKIEQVVSVPKGVHLTQNFAIPIGRSKHRKVTPKDYRLDETRFLGCNPGGVYDVTVYPDGEVYPCCSGGFNIEAKLSFGNLKREPLQAIVERIHRDFFVSLVMEQGFWLLYRIAAWKFPEVYRELPNWDELVSPCQLCAKIHRDGRLMEALQPVFDYLEKLFDAATTLPPPKCLPKISA